MGLMAYIARITAMAKMDIENTNRVAVMPIETETSLGGPGIVIEIRPGCLRFVIEIRTLGL